MFKKRNNLPWLPMAAILALIAVAFLAAPAFAQDEAPAEPSPEEAPAEAIPAEEAPAEEPAVVEIVATSAEGEVLPLASEEAAEVLTGGDPWWKVGTITYRFLSGMAPNTCALVDPTNPYCFEDPNPIQASLAYIMINATAVPTDGLVHVEAGPYTDPAININGTSGNLGKLKGLIGSLSPTTNLPSAILTNSMVTVQNMPGAFLLSGFNVTGNSADGVVRLLNNTGAITLQDLVVVNNNAGGSAVGIYADQKGAITLTRVDSSGNTSNGAYLKNDTGTGAVTITNASFDNNNGTVNSALTIISKGAIALNNISVAYNDTRGVSITTSKSLLIKNSNFHDNAGDGVNISTGSLGTVNFENVYLLNNTNDGANITVGGTVSLKNIMAQSNNRFGVVVNTCGSDPCDMVGVGTVTVINSTFTNNQNINTSFHWAGLSILAKGAITLNNVSATGNGYYAGGANYSRAYGAYLSNQRAVTPANISITQGIFDGNYWTGLAILTKGSVSLNTISASGNGIPAAPDWQIHGMDIDATYGTGSVTLTSTLGESIFDDNDGTGININAKGSVSLSGKIGGESSSSSNGTSSEGRGIWVDNAAGLGSVTIKNFNLLSNQNNGLRVLSKGAITLDTLDVNNNGLGTETIGADIANDSAPSAKAVIINASSFQGNIGEGLHIYTKGSVTLNGINASSNTSGASDPCGAFISADYGTGSVTMLSSKGVNYFTGNDGSGLVIYANGKVSLDTLTTVNNANDDGVYIRTTTAGDVVVKKLTSYGNGNSGLYVQAFGNITVDNTILYGNGLVSTLYSGAYLNNAGGTLAKYVTVTRSSFYDTPTWGLRVDSLGLITLNHVSAYDNTIGGGAFLQNDYAGSTAGVSVLSSYGDNFFDNNEDHGLEIQSNGSVMLSKIDSETNHGDGVNVYNLGGTGGVTINTGYFAGNYGSALYIQTNGKISISNVTADTNGTTYSGAALYLDNSSSPVIESTVTVLRTSVFDQQNGTGINITSKGVVVLNTVISYGNSAPGSMGVYIDNRASSKNAGISILASYGRNYFSGNAVNGLYLRSDGTITIAKADVSSNNGSGALLENNTGIGSVVITDSNFSGNPYGTGISITTRGKVTWIGGGASGNGTSASGMGAGIINTTSPSPMPVSISKAVFSGNYGDGLQVLANGQITLNNVTASDNSLSGSEYGAYLENAGWVGGISVLSSYGANAFSGNGEDGLFIHTTGAVVLSKISAQLNNRYGIVVDNAEGSSTASVSFTTGSVDQNYHEGLYVESFGNITLTGIHASENGYGAGSGDGAELNNLGGVNKYIKITSSIFESNDGFGLYAQSNGAITLSGVTGALNTSFGASLNNDTGTGSISILSSKFLENLSFGFGITSAGPVTISGVTANENLASGIYIGNTSGTANVTITSSTASENGGEGITVTSRGGVTISSSKVENNSGYGARLINTFDTSGTKSVTVKNSTFSGNVGGYGLRIESHGAVLISAVKAENNSAQGAWIDNLSGTTTGTPIVTMSGTNSFCNNNDDGLVVYGKGVVTLSGITASNNNGYGMFLNTDTGSAINIINATLKQNNENGIFAISGGAINISGMVVLFNGTTANYSGAYLSATGYDITIKNSSVNANGASGIVAYTGATHTLYLTGVNYFGNDYFGGVADSDLSFDGLLVLK